MVKTLKISWSSIWNKRKTTILFPSPLTFLQWPIGLLWELQVPYPSNGLLVLCPEEGRVAETSVKTKNNRVSFAIFKFTLGNYAAQDFQSLLQICVCPPIDYKHLMTGPKGTVSFVSPRPLNVEEFELGSITVKISQRARKNFCSYRKILIGHCHKGAFQGQWSQMMKQNNANDLAMVKNPRRPTRLRSVVTFGLQICYTAGRGVILAIKHSNKNVNRARH